MNRILGAFLVVMAVCFLASCDSGADSVPAANKGSGQQEIDVRGTITHMRQASAEMAREGIVGVILVEGDSQEGTRFESIDVQITADTSILIQGESHAAGFAQLSIGQVVEIQLDGPTKDADPPLGDARVVVIKSGAP